MNLGPGWTERTSSSDFARIFDHEAGYIIWGVIEPDGRRRWDIAKGRGRGSRIVSERPFRSIYEACAEAERRIEIERRAIASNLQAKYTSTIKREALAARGA